MTNLIIEYNKDNMVKELECCINTTMDIETFIKIVKGIELSTKNNAKTKFNSIKTNEIIEVNSNDILCVKSVELGVKKTFKAV